MIWSSHVFKNFPQFVVIYTVKGFSVVNENEVDIFPELSCLFYDPVDVCFLLRDLAHSSRYSGHVN